MSEEFTAGRELDAEIARRLFGVEVAVCPKVWSDEDWQCSDYPTEENALGIPNRSFRPGGMAPPASPLPRYSENIEAAWEVVEKMDRDGWAFTLESDGTGKWWGATFWQGDTFHDGYASTAPYAICHAARLLVHRTAPPKAPTGPIEETT